MDFIQLIDFKFNTIDEETGFILDEIGEKIYYESSARIYTENGIRKIEYFKKEIMNGLSIIEVTDDNREYLKRFEYLFDIPNKVDLINYLIAEERYEDIILINNNVPFTHLESKEKIIENIILELRKRILNSLI
jgi:hypothetical protein